MTVDEATSVLGLEAGATAEDVETAWRELAQMLHPDRYGSNAKLRARAERQMARINEARDVLRKTAGRTGTTRSGTAHAASAAASPAQIAHEAQLRANAAETARIQIVTQVRTMSERRAGYVRLVVIAGIGALICSRLRGTVGALGFSIASMLVVWSAVDAVTLSNQIRALDTRAAELLKTRDAALRIAREASEL